MRLCVEDKNKNGRYVEYGSVYWYRNGLLHREDGPAAEYKDGEWEWYFNGELHRNGEPAKISWTCEIEYRDWYQHGKLHREDGPARTDGDGNYAYFLDGKELTEEEFNAYLERKKLKESLGRDLDMKTNNNKKSKI